MSWDEARVERAKALYAAGHSASQIGAALGVTRNTVIGKLTRLGVMGRGEARAPAPLRTRAAIPPPREFQQRSKRPEPESGPEPIGALNIIVSGACQWIHGDVGSPAGWRMCGHPGKPWCDFHKRKAVA